MQCELCGNECKDCKPATVDGVKMMLCPGCMRHGKGLRSSLQAEPRNVVLQRISRPREKDVFVNMDKELVSKWNEKIKDARKKKGLTREQLGFNIGERTVTISKIENGDLRPSDKVITKLEKELEIKLIESVKEVPSTKSAGVNYGGGLTLGDFIKNEKK
jgi:putative transcription factor